MNNTLVFVVEDDQPISELICFNLERDGFRTEALLNGADVPRLVEQKSPALVLLDLMLPGLDGFEVCRRLKTSEKSRGIPIVMITARGSEGDILKGLQLGADDYIVKPFSPKVLLARVRAVLRRAAGAEGGDASGQRDLGALQLDGPKRRLLLRGVPVELTALEFDIVEFLSRFPGRVFSREQLLDGVWKEGRFIIDRAVDVHVRNIRRKLGDAADRIETVRGVGYRFKELDP